MLRLFATITTGLAISIGLAAGSLQAQDDRRRGARETVTADLGKDHFAAGRSITVSQPVEGDLLAAGGDVAVESNVGGDAVVAGGTLHLNGAVARNVYAAGGRVTVSGALSRNARLAGGNIEITPSGRIDGGLTVAGGDVRVNGPIGGYLQAAGGTLYLNGPVAGDVEASGGRIELGPNARIAGALRYRSRQALTRDPAAQVTGVIEQLPPLGPPRASGGRRFLRAVFGIWLLWTIGLMTALAVLLLVLPVFFGGVIETLGKRPGASALLGFVLLVCTPVAMLLLFITIIGAPLALLLLAIYGALLLVGYVAAGAAVGDWLLKRFHYAGAVSAGTRIAAAVIGIFALAVLGAVPVLGGLVSFAALLLGLGAVVLAMHRALSSPRPAG